MDDLKGAVSAAGSSGYLFVDELRILVAKHKARRRAGKIAESSDFEKAEALGKAQSLLTRLADSEGQICADIDFPKGDQGDYVAIELRRQGLQVSVFDGGLKIRASWGGNE